MTGNRRILTRIAVLSALVCIAWVSANFALRPVVVNQGGGRAASSNFSMTASIGGPVVSTSSSTNFTINANTVNLVQAGAVQIPIPPTTPTTPSVDTSFSFTGGGCAAPGRGASPWAFAGLAAMVCLAACRMRRRVAG